MFKLAVAKASSAGVEVISLEIEATADDVVLLSTDDAGGVVEEVVALEVTCNCLWSAIH